MKMQRLIKSRIQKKPSKQDAQDFLSKLNVSIDYTTDENFSLLADTQNSDDLTRSPNVMDSSKWEGIKNEPLSTEKNFPNLEDPFLKMDVTLEQIEPPAPPAPDLVDLVFGTAPQPAPKVIAKPTVPTIKKIG